MTLCFEVFSAATDATDLAYTWGLEDGAEGVQAVCPLLGGRGTSRLSRGLYRRALARQAL